MELNESLSDSQVRFALWLECRMPKLLRFFDFDKREIIPSLVEGYLEIASRTEKIMVKFIAMVWSHQNNYDFCLVEAVKNLNENQLNIVLEWIKDPIWP
ncbi:MAG: hypothetical protein Alis3KO_05570 [Aliiglaciecola sp.]